VSLALANFNSTTDDILEMVAKSSVPRATVLGGEPASLALFDANTVSNITPSQITATRTTTTYRITAAATTTNGSGNSSKKSDAVSRVSGQLSLFSFAAAVFGLSGSTISAVRQNEGVQATLLAGDRFVHFLG
jgi:hypothetical protein